MINLLLFQAPSQCFSHMLRRSLGTSQKLNIAQINKFLKPLYIHTENCLDRHAEENPRRVALIWEKDEPNQQEKVTYRYSASTIKPKQSLSHHEQ